MASYILKKTVYGLLVLLGVVSIVFFIFSFVPDPSRELAGQAEDEEVVQAIRKKLGLDLPIGKRYLLFLNDLSPLSLHHGSENSRTHFNEENYTGFLLSNSDSWNLAIKKPYVGRSFLSDRKVSEIISSALPGTILLALVAMAIAFILGVFLGVISAVNKDSLIDKSILFLTSIGMSGPSFFMAILIAWLGAVVLKDRITISFFLIGLLIVCFCLNRFTSIFKNFKMHWVVSSILIFFFFWMISWFSPQLNSFVNPGIHLPGTGLNLTGSLYEVDVWEGKRIALQNLILPAITLGIRPLAVIIQLTRNSMLDVMSMDYIRTAYAKGLSQKQVLLKHALRNALNPVVTAASGWLSSMLAGAVFVEFVFGWKGLGLEVFRSLEKNDLPVVLGAVLVIAAIFVLVNILVDLIYGWIDPRARVST